MDPVVVDTLRLGLGLLFATALVHKVRDVERFRATLGEYRLVPAPLVAAASAGVLAAEGAAVALLVLPGWSATGLAWTAGLLLGYGAAIAVNLGRSRAHIDCGCGGFAGREEISWWLVGRNVVCAALALAGSFPVVPRERAWIDGVTLVAATTALAALYAAVDQLVANRPGYRRVRGIA